MKASGFSLIELIVVIAIISTLAALAVPAYGSYRTRVMISNAGNILAIVLQDAMIKYQQTGNFPSSVYIGATAVSAGSTSVAISSISGLTSASYRYFTSGTSGANVTGVYMDAGFAPGSLPSSALSATGSLCSANFCNIRAASVLTSTGINKYYCGIWTTADTYSVSLEHQPRICNCTNFANLSFGILGGGAGTDSC